MPKNSVPLSTKLSLACRKDLMLVFSMVMHELYMKFNCHSIMQLTKTKTKKKKKKKKKIWTISDPSIAKEAISAISNRFTKYLKKNSPKRGVSSTIHILNLSFLKHQLRISFLDYPASTTIYHHVWFAHHILLPSLLVYLLKQSPPSHLNLLPVYSLIFLPQVFHNSPLQAPH